MNEKSIRHGAQYLATEVISMSKLEYGAEWKDLTVNQELALIQNLEKQLQQIANWQKPVKLANS